MDIKTLEQTYKRLSKAHDRQIRHIDNMNRRLHDIDRLSKDFWIEQIRIQQGKLDGIDLARDIVWKAIEHGQYY